MSGGDSFIQLSENKKLLDFLPFRWRDEIGFGGRLFLFFTGGDRDPLSATARWRHSIGIESAARRGAGYYHVVHFDVHGALLSYPAYAALDHAHGV